MLKKIGKKLWTVIGSVVVLPAVYVMLSQKLGVDDTTAKEITAGLGALVGLQISLHTVTDVQITKKAMELKKPGAEE